MIYILLLMFIPVLGWTLLGVIPNKYFNQMIDGKKKKPKNDGVKEELSKTDNWVSFVKEKD